MTKTKIFFRADGSSAIGLGHVFRSLALAEMLIETFDCTFAIQAPSEALHREIFSVCSDVISLPATPYGDSAFLHELDNYLAGDEIVVLDGYNFDTAYQQQIKGIGCSVVCVDDIPSYPFVSDIVINHSGVLRKDDYHLAPYTLCCFGPQYALLRQPFLSMVRSERDQQDLKRAFVNLGGADPHNDLSKVLNLLKSINFFEEIHVVTGLAYQYADDLVHQLASDGRIQIHRSLTAAQMAELMYICGAAICPPSTVAYEYASIGGLLFLHQIAENQKLVSQFFLGNQMALDFRELPEVIHHPQLLAITKATSQQQHCHFDGKSQERLLSVFMQLSKKQSLSIRKAEKEDVYLTYAWINDSSVRLQSYQPDPIPFETHEVWFSRKLSDSLTMYYIVEFGDKPAGQIRFESKNGELVISYLITPDFRGKGLGTALLLRGIERALADYEEDVSMISGYVKKSNIASLKSFNKAGFTSKPTNEDVYPDSVKFEKIIAKPTQSGYR